MNAYYCCLLRSLHLPLQSFTSFKAADFSGDSVTSKIGFCLKPSESIERRQLIIEAFGPIKERCSCPSAGSSAKWWW